MISHDYKCIFIHIPKCAGTSIESALGHLDIYRGFDKQDHRAVRVIQKPLCVSDVFTSLENIRFLMLRFYYRLKRESNPKNKYLVTGAEYSKYYKFTFVRNPWDRAYSSFKNVVRDPKHREKYGCDEDMEFSDFLKKYIGVGFLRSQLYWLREYSGEINFDFIGKFENLQSDFEIVAKELGVDSSLPHHIRGCESSPSYREVYDEESRMLVANYYKEEIEMFSYSF